MNIKYFVRFIALLLLPIYASAAISGTVHKDLPRNGTQLNVYGTQDNNEPGIEGIEVTAYPGGLSTTTDENGSWTLNTNEDVRIEFSNLPIYLRESHNNMNQNSIQFITDGSNNITFALHNPVDYVGTNPQLATTHFINGKEDPDAGPLATIFAWPYNNTGDINSNQTTLTTTSNVRSVWGLAYSSSRKSLYAATFLRRHSSIGGNGLGAIYQIDTDTNTTVHLIDIPNVGSIGSDTDRALNDATEGNTDSDAFAKVGKVGLGDIEISEDESTLFVMNLNDKKIYEIDIDSNTITTSYLAPSPSCTNGENRPFALTHYNNALHIGTICDASSSACDTSLANQCSELTAHVHKIVTGETNSTEILNIRLDYDKPQTIATGTGKKKNWNPWTDTYADLYDNYMLIHPVPILTTVKFDTQDNLLLGFSDRTAIQGGSLTDDLNGQAFERYTFSGADVLKAELMNDGSYSLVDFNFFDDATVASNHQEGALGAITHIKGTKSIVITQYDNIEVPNTSFTYTKGVTFLREDNGSKDSAYRVTDNNRPSYFGKNMGLGDLEVLSEEAPLSIGNRVWSDDNGNCIQDANESGINNILIKLIGDVNQTTLTQNNGNYLFNNLEKNKNYLVQITDINNTSELTGKTLTNCTNGGGEGSNSLLNNNDATLNGNSAEILINSSDIQTIGTSNYSFDFGFKPTVSIVTPIYYTLGNKLWIDTNKDGIQDNNESGYDGATVTLYNSSDCTGAALNSVTTSNGGMYEFTSLEAGTYCLAFTNLPTDYNITNATQGSDVTMDSNANSNGQITNINLTTDDATQDVGIYPATAVLAVINHDDGICSCHPYETKSVSSMNILGILFIIITTLFTSFKFRNEF